MTSHNHNFDTAEAPVRPADLQGVRDRLLTPREICRDASGMLDHPSFPVFDEDVNTRLLLKALGLDASFVLMEDDDPEARGRLRGLLQCLDTHAARRRVAARADLRHGGRPCAMFVRKLPIVPAPQRWRGATDAEGRNEWELAQGVSDHSDVDAAFRRFAEELTDHNATHVVRAVLRRAVAQQASERAAKDKEIAKLQDTCKMFGSILQDQIVANQSAWIERQHGKGAEAALEWVHNGLAGPGQIPDEAQPYSKEAQAWFDANRSNPYPRCFCGRPSNIGWMKHGFCSQAHFREGKARTDNNKDSSEKGIAA